MIVTQWGLPMRRGVLFFFSFSYYGSVSWISSSFAFPGLIVVGAEERNGKVCSVKRARRPPKFCSYDDIKIIESST